MDPCGFFAQMRRTVIRQECGLAGNTQMGRTSYSGFHWVVHFTIAIRPVSKFIAARCWIGSFLHQLEQIRDTAFNLSSSVVAGCQNAELPREACEMTFAFSWTRMVWSVSRGIQSRLCAPCRCRAGSLLYGPERSQPARGDQWSCRGDRIGSSANRRTRGKGQRGIARHFGLN